MVKGGLLKDDTEWAKAGIKPGQKLMMMGTADVVPTAPTGNQVPNNLPVHISVYPAKLKPRQMPRFGHALARLLRWLLHFFIAAHQAAAAHL